MSSHDRGRKRAAGELSSMSFTQEEQVADVYWGEPQSDFDCTQEASFSLHESNNDEDSKNLADWAPPFSRRHDFHDINDKRTYKDRTLKSEKAIRAILSPVDELLDSEDNSFNEDSFLGGQFIAIDSAVYNDENGPTILRQNGQNSVKAVKNDENLAAKGVSKNMSMSTGSNENECPQRKQEISSSPGLADSEVLSLSVTEPSVSCRNDQQQKKETVFCSRETGRMSASTVHQRNVNPESARPGTPADPYYAKRMEALRKRRLSLESKNKPLLSGSHVKSSIKPVCYSNQRKPAPVRYPKPNMQKISSEGSSSTQGDELDDLESIEALMRNYDKVKVVSNMSNVSENREKEIKCMSVKTTDVAMEKEKCNVTINNADSGTETSEFDAIEAMMNSVEEKYYQSRSQGHVSQILPPASTDHNFNSWNRQKATPSDSGQGVINVTPQPTCSERKCHQLIVIEANVILDDRGRPIKRLHCLNYFQSSKQISTSSHIDSLSNVIVFLCDNWAESDVRSGDMLHVIYALRADDFAPPESPAHTNSSSSSNHCDDADLVVDDTQGLLIIHPEIVLSPTRIAETYSCSRKAVLSERTRSGVCGQAAALGTLKHQFCEKIVKMMLSSEDMSPRSSGSRLDFHKPSIENIIKAAVSEQATALYSAGVSDDAATSTLQSMSAAVVQWVQSGISIVSPGDPSHGFSLQWSSLYSCEETILSPSLGLKGQIDMVLTAHNSSRKHLGDSLSPEMLLPVELKTGKWRASGLVSHRAQLILYIVMIALRNSSSLESPNVSYPSGVLLYLNEEETRYEVIFPNWAEIRALIFSRNKLATSIKHAGESSQMIGTYIPDLPPLLKNSSCGGCYSAAECMLYHQSSTVKQTDNAEDGQLFELAAESSGLPSLLKRLCGHISWKQLRYFKKWDRLLDLEQKASEANSNRRTDVQKEFCFELHSLCAASQRIFGELNGDWSRFEHIWSFKPWDGEREAPSFAAGDRVTVSVQKNSKPYASFSTLGNCGHSTDIEDVATPYLWDISNVEPRVASGVVLQAVEGFVYLGFIELSRRIQSLSQIAAKQNCDGGKWHFALEKEEISISFTNILRSNVIRLILPPHDPKSYYEAKKHSPVEVSPSLPPPLSTRLSQLVIDLAAPQFSSKTNALTGQLASIVDDEIFLFLPPNIASYANLLQCLQSESQQMNHESKVSNTERFVKSNPACSLYDGCMPMVLLKEYHSLNEGQRKAVRKVSLAKDYALLLGMPGCGKTLTLSFIIRALVARGQRILITSFTNAAVDNLVEKLIASGLSSTVLGRLGHSFVSTESEVSEYMIHPARSSERVIGDLAQTLQGYRVIATTVLTASRSGLLRKLSPFDWCVMDEAGQISQPASIGCMLLAEKYLLVGDDYQLPPLVVSLEAQSEGMDVSMFRRLGKAHPNASVYLTSQYRMNAEIMSLCNALIYEQRLSCGNRNVAEAKLEYSRYENWMKHLHRLPLKQTEWLRRCIDPDSSVIFLNTDTLRDVSCEQHCVHDGREQDSKADGHSFSKNSILGLSNPTEIVAIMLLLETFSICGVKDFPSSVGIVSPYRNQVQHLKNGVRCIGDKSIYKMIQPFSSYMPSATDTEMLIKNGISTVDKYQGRDMEVIIFSFVRSNLEGKVGDLLRDWRRVNVALTRAKKKLILIGSLDMMSYVPVLNLLRVIVEENGWVVNMLPGALTFDS